MITNFRCANQKCGRIAKGTQKNFPIRLFDKDNNTVGYVCYKCARKYAKSKLKELNKQQKVANKKEQVNSISNIGINKEK